MLKVIYGSSGSGKTALSNRAFGKQNKIITYTTRSPRKGEVNGEDYFFISKEEFFKKVSEGFFYEHSKYANNYYGTSNESIQEGIKNNKFIIVELQGLKYLKQKFPNDILGIYIQADAKNLVDSLNRREDSLESAMRIQHLKEEQNYVNYADVVFKNKFSGVVEDSIKLKQMIGDVINEE